MRFSRNQHVRSVQGEVHEVSSQRAQANLAAPDKAQLQLPRPALECSHMMAACAAVQYAAMLGGQTIFV